MMKETDLILLSFIRKNIDGAFVGPDISSITASQWTEIIRAAFVQGLPAFAYDGFEALLKASPGRTRLSLDEPGIRKYKLKWLGSVIRTEESNDRYLSNVKRLTDIYHENGLRTVVLKGLSCASYYPVPRHRPGGDFDCYLCGGYELGNDLAEKAGAKVDRNFHYKHSHISFPGFVVENHRFCTAFRGDRRKEELERHLQSLLDKPSSEYVDGTSLELPPPEFNALFLTSHAFFHFLAEGLNLKQLVDWALFMRTEQNNVDWEEFYTWTDRLNLTRFADAMNTLAVERLGIIVTAPGAVCSSPYADAILEDIFSHKKGLYNTSSTHRIRLGFLRNQFCSIWKYHRIYRKCMSVELMKMALGVLSEKTSRR